jgi:hypothetical protein
MVILHTLPIPALSKIEFDLPSKLSINKKIVDIYLSSIYKILTTGNYKQAKKFMTNTINIFCDTTIEINIELNLYDKIIHEFYNMLIELNSKNLNSLYDRIHNLHYYIYLY